MRAGARIKAISAPLVVVAMLAGCGGPDPGVIETGVEVASVEVGGMRAERAREVLRSRLDDSLARRLVAKHRRERIRLPRVRPAIRVDVGAVVKDALRADAHERVRLEPHLRVSRRALEPLVERVRAAVETPPRNARLVPTGATLRKVSARDGLAVRAGELEGAILAELTRARSGGVLEAPVSRIEAALTDGELAARHPHLIAIDRAGFRLRLYEDLRLAKTYKIAVGQVGYDTPAGRYRVQNKAVNPAWSVPDAPWTGDLAGRVIPPGPSNPIKARWMGFFDGAGIHGTDELGSLGTAASHGCIRMAVPDVIELYRRVEVGTPVFVA